MTPDDINQITGDDVMYWLGNKFMSPADEIEQEADRG